MISIAKVTDEERMKRYDKLGLSEEEKRELLEYDKKVEAGESTEYDLKGEQLKTAQKFAHTGQRKPTVYKFNTRQRKPNATKGGIIAELAEFMKDNSQFNVANLEITNAERQISFQIGEETFELTLVQKRKKK